MEDITRTTHIKVTYDNPKTGEHEAYKQTIADLEDDMNGMLNTEALIAKLTSDGVAVMGMTTATIDGMDFDIEEYRTRINAYVDEVWDDYAERLFGIRDELIDKVIEDVDIVLPDEDDACDKAVDAVRRIALTRLEGYDATIAEIQDDLYRTGEAYHYHDTGGVGLIQSIMPTATHSLECFDLTRSEVDANLEHESDEFGAWIRGNPAVGAKFFGEGNDVARVERIR